VRSARGFRANQCAGRLLRLVRGGSRDRQREGKREDGPITWRAAFDHEAASVTFGELPADVQSEPGAPNIAKSRFVGPMEALENSRWKPTRRRSSTEARGARVLPAAITAAPRGDGPIGRLTANAAMAMAGQTRRPMTNMATRAIPVGGQIGVTRPCTSARFRLRRAASQYARATSASRKNSLAGRSERPGCLGV
jgi:hypothetical protein